MSLIVGLDGRCVSCGKPATVTATDASDVRRALGLIVYAGSELWRWSPGASDNGRLCARCYIEVVKT